MQFRADEYYQVSVERMAQAVDIYHRGEAFALAMYCAGLSVESLLRAFRWKEDATFDGRHDLYELLLASRLLEFNDGYMIHKCVSEESITEWRLKLKVAMSEVARLWHNNFRFASEARLKTYLQKAGRLKGVKGNPLKKNALDLIQAAQTIVDRGSTIWISERKFS